MDWVTEEWTKRTGKIFRDPDRQIRKLYQEGFLIKIQKGLYRYEPDAVHEKQLLDFTQKQKDTILEWDGYKCVMCGHGRKEGDELHVDHIKPRELGGKSTLDNGQTLYSRHNMLKSKLKQTETGKDVYTHIRYSEKRKRNGIARFLC